MPAVSTGLLCELTEARVWGGLGLKAPGAHLPWGSAAGECKVSACMNE